MTLPELKNVAGAYGIHFVEMLTTNDIRQKVQECLKLEGPVICRVLVSKNHVTAPRVMSRQTESGSMETAPMEEMWP